MTDPRLRKPWNGGFQPPPATLYRTPYDIVPIPTDRDILFLTFFADIPIFLLILQSRPYPLTHNQVIDRLYTMTTIIHIYEPSPTMADKMKSERVRLTPARAMLIIMLADIYRFGEFASVFAAEKLIYFMQRLGAKDIFKIDFKPYIYGPYSGGKVAHVLSHLNGSYIKGMTALEARPFDFIWLTDDAEKEAIAYLQGFNDNSFLEICNKTKALLRTFYSNYSLELLSTVDFILHRLSPASAWKQEDRNTLESTVSTEMQKWSTRKGQIFKSEFIRKAIDHLRVSDIP